MVDPDASPTDSDAMLEELAGLPTLAHPAASPDGDEIAFYYDVSGRNELHVLDVESGTHEQWSDGEVPRNARWHVEWGAGGEQAFFHLDDDGNEQNDVYAIDSDGSVEAVVEMDGQVVIQDVASAAEHVLSTREWLDEDRVVVFGGSYGGYSAYWQLVQYPDLYDAGVAWIGLTDLTDQYENTMPHFKTELMEKNMGTPDENPGLYEERSPITYVDNLAAPLFMVHGVNDRRVPVSQARLFRDALETAGYAEGPDGDFEYRELGEEGHASSDIEQKKRLFRLLDDFLDRRIGTETVAADD